jgi:hypothetical protein
MGVLGFLQAVVRLSNLYGIPKIIYSDNAKTFIAGGNILEKALASTEFSEFFEQGQIRHLTIPLYSAWVGATWERLIRVVKSCLYKVVGRSKVGYFELLTTLSDIQCAINSRPLTYRTSANELEIITPLHFVLPGVNPALSVTVDEAVPVWGQDINRDSLMNILARRDEALEQFKRL